MTATDPIQTIAAYFKTKPEVSAVYLFGSYAQATQRRFSDLDLGILFSQHGRAAAIEKTHRFRLDLSRQLRKELHITPLNHASEALLKQVFAKGRCIVENDPKHLCLFKMTAYAKIADFGYHKQRMQTGFFQKLTGAGQPKRPSLNRPMEGRHD